MAIVQPTITPRGDGVVEITWAGMASGDYGYPVMLPKHSDKSFQAYGTNGTSPSGSLYGTNDFTMLGTAPTSGNWKVLTEPDGSTAITGTALPTDVEVVLQSPLLVAPAVTDGTGSSITVTLICIRQA
jgi:hypothetical protein